MYRMPGMKPADAAAAQILMDVLNNPRSSVSDLAAQGKVLSADAGSQPFSQGGIGIVQAGFPKGGDAKQAQAYLDGVIDDMLKNGVPADLVEAAKRSELAQFEFNKNSAVIAGQRMVAGAGVAGTGFARASGTADPRRDAWTTSTASRANT